MRVTPEALLIALTKREVFADQTLWSVANLLGVRHLGLTQDRGDHGMGRHRRRLPARLGAIQAPQVKTRTTDTGSSRGKETFKSTTHTNFKLPPLVNPSGT